MGNTTAVPMTGIASKDRITADDVAKLRREMFGDGLVTRSEAEALLLLDASAAERCAEWEPLLVEAVTDYIVRQEEPFGYISEENADWLVAAVSSGRMVGSAAGLELLVKVLEDAKYSPPRLSAFALRQVMHAVVEGNGPLMAGGSLVPGRIPGPRSRSCAASSTPLAATATCGPRAEAEICSHHEMHRSAATTRMDDLFARGRNSSVSRDTAARQEAPAKLLPQTTESRIPPIAGIRCQHPPAVITGPHSKP